jgi:hypothetical protein
VKKMMRLKHWQDAVIAVVGVWLISSPWVMGFRGEVGATANASIVGFALVAVAVDAIFVPSPWEELTLGAIGVWMIASPWVLDVSGGHGAGLAAIVTGTVIVVLALWSLFSDNDYGAWGSHAWSSISRRLSRPRKAS